MAITKYLQIKYHGTENAIVLKTISFKEFAEIALESTLIKSDPSIKEFVHVCRHDENKPCELIPIESYKP